MTFKDAERYKDLIARADECRDKATAALDADSPVGFREWMEAHDAARRAANTIKLASAPGKKVSGSERTKARRPSAHG